jgi:hypothetical protein
LANADDLLRIARSLEGTHEAPHVDRIALKVARTYATLAADGLTANLKLAPEEQEFSCLMAPEAFSPVPGGWGRMGWTTLRLDAVDEARLRQALETAWRHALPRPRARRKR